MTELMVANKISDGIFAKYKNDGKIKLQSQTREFFQYIYLHTMGNLIKYCLSVNCIICKQYKLCNISINIDIFCKIVSIQQLFHSIYKYRNCL